MNVMSLSPEIQLAQGIHTSESLGTADEYAAPALVITDLAFFQETPVPAVQVVQVPQVQMIAKKPLRFRNPFLVKALKLPRVWDLLPFAN